MSKWVHVVEGLPKKAQIVIVWDGHESKLACLNNDDRWCMRFPVRRTEPNITHWKPLPKPPKVQKETESPTAPAQREPQAVTD